MVIKKMVMLVIFGTLFSCGMNTRYLNGDSGKVPVEGYVFDNRHLFSPAIYDEISTGNLYKLTDAYYCDKNLNKIDTKKSYPVNWVLLFQFYDNGCVRRFPEKFSSADPEVVGNRGIVYRQDQDSYIDICEAISNNKMVINTYRIYPRGNQLLITQTNGNPLLNERRCYIYEKADALSADWKKYKADW